jgi:hypothetical protein
LQCRGVRKDRNFARERRLALGMTKRQIRYWNGPVDRSTEFTMVIVYCVGPERGGCGHNAMLKFADLPDWNWQDISAYLKCTKCGAIGYIEPATEQELLALLRPSPDEWLKIWPVDNKVGNVRNTGAELKLPIELRE